SGMLTSRRMTAASCSRRNFSASRPDPTETIRSPRSASAASTVSLWVGRSSTTRMFTGRVTSCSSADQPRPQHGEQLVLVYRLREVIPRPGVDAFLPVSLHRLRRPADAGQIPEPPDLTNRPRLVSVAEIQDRLTLRLRQILQALVKDERGQIEEPFGALDLANDGGLREAPHRLGRRFREFLRTMDEHRHAGELPGVDDLVDHL